MKKSIIKLDIENLKEIENIESVYKSKVTSIGNGAMIKSMKKYLGKEAIILILMDDPREKIKENADWEFWGAFNEKFGNRDPSDKEYFAFAMEYSDKKKK